MDKKLKGDISETAVIAKCTRLGFGVSVPVGDRFTYDLIVDNGLRLIKIQVKSIYLASNGSLKCAGARRTLTNRTTTKYKTYDKGDFDYVVAYYMDTNDFYIIPEDVFLTSTSQFTIEPSGTQRKLKIDTSLFKNNWSIIK